jgi:hypothetical protein
MSRKRVYVAVKSIGAGKIDSDSVVKRARLFKSSLGASYKEFVVESHKGGKPQALYREFIERAAISNRIKVLDVRARSERERKRKGHSETYARTRCGWATTGYN